jgi:hypothetical protein
VSACRQHILQTAHEDARINLLLADSCEPFLRSILWSDCSDVADAATSGGTLKSITDLAEQEGVTDA